jgi:hypothetical protein
MTRGIYITANDKVIEQAIALLNSIRYYDRETPIMLIPYDDNYGEIAQILTEKYNVKIYRDLNFIERLSQKLYDLFGEGFFARPNQFRKQACWFGEFDEFLYIDTDIVVFEKIIDNLNHLQDYDFLCCDYQHAGGIRNVFAKDIIEKGVFTEQETQDIFNCGFWASKKNLLSEQDLYDVFGECAAHPEYFDFSHKTSDQPIINYMILTRVNKRLNLVKKPEGKGAGSWGGSKHFQRQGNILIDTNTNQPLQYIHWAGIKIKPGCPYWDIWKHYRYLNESDPPKDPPIWQNNFQKIFQQVKTNIKNKLK